MENTLRPVHGYGLHVMRNPSGTWGFVGTVPCDLSLNELATGADVMAGRYWFPSRLKAGPPRTTRTPNFATRVEAVAHAERFGFAVAGEPAGVPPTCSCGEDYGDDAPPCDAFQAATMLDHWDTGKPLCICCGHVEACHLVPPTCGCPVNAPEADPATWPCPCGDHCSHPGCGDKAVTCSTCDGSGVTGCSPGCPLGDLREDAAMAPLCSVCGGHGIPCPSCCDVEVPA